MADEQYKWLTGETAERLLRGESLEAVDESGREQAEELGRALKSLATETAPATEELPGEQAALAAFRKAREAAEAERTAAALGGAGPAGHPARTAREPDAGLVRIGTPTRTGTRSGRPRWARPVRLALAAAVAAGTLGGVAVAAGSGVLPVPFQDEPGPAASVSAQNSSRPSASPSPQPTQGIVPDLHTPSAGPSGSPGADPFGNADGRDNGRGKDKGTDKGAEPGKGTPPGTRGTEWRKAVTSACRDLRDGRDPGAERRRILEFLAGGSARVTRYCTFVLAAQSPSGGENKGDDGNDAKGDGGKDGKDGKGDGKGDGDGHGGDDGGHWGRDHRHGRHRGGLASHEPSVFTPQTGGRPVPALSPSPSYTAL
ncbi:hypothetical protein ACFZCP_00765 [Streptomyces sp. NPDC007971]|uniref:hypothetical protein n=1 Tax=Streptomyces sp. NPDC007971 TaxID=3364799 RepID=UPI0036E9CD8A